MAMFRLERCDETFARTARHRFVNEIRTRADPRRAFEVVTSSELEHEWFPDFVSAEWQTPAPHGTGSRRLYRLKYMRILEEFQIWEPGRRLVFCVTQCSLPLLSRFLEHYVLVPDGSGGTRIEWNVCYEPNPRLAFLHPVLRAFFASDFRKASVQLRSLLDREAGR